MKRVLLLTALLVACGSSPSHLRLRLTADAGVGGLDRIEARAKTGAGGAVQVSAPYVKVLADRDLGEEPWVVELEVPGDSGFAATVRIAVLGQRDGTIVASAVLQADLGGTDTIDVILAPIPGGCDDDGDGYQACDGAACCKHGEDDGFSDCDDARAEANPFADTAACRTCEAGCGASEGDPDATEPHDASDVEVVDDARPHDTPDPGDAPSDVEPGPEVPEPADVPEADGDLADAIQPDGTDADEDPGSPDLSDACAPECTGKQCGDDGCGGSCGSCSTGKECLAGVCVCDDECAPSGLNACTDATHVRTCGDPDGDSCLEWGAAIACGAGKVCSGDGECKAVPTGFVTIPAGWFWMGSPGGEACASLSGYTGGSCAASGTATPEPGRGDDEALHRVTLSTSFELLDHEVTQAEWHAVFPEWDPSQNVGDAYPVDSLSWFDAAAYANARSEAVDLPRCYLFAAIYCQNGDLVAEPGLCMTETRKGIDSAAIQLNEVETPYACTGYRLPMEAEWEYAYRAGSVSAFYPSAGNDGSVKNPGDDCNADANLDQIGWYCGDSTSASHVTGAAGGKEPNAWGLYDLAGNVWEWCWDRQGTYPAGEVADPDGGSGTTRVFRGGSFGSVAHLARAANRSAETPFKRLATIGARIARSLPGVAGCPVGTAFVDNGDGTLGDPATCLTWQVSPPEAMSWAAARAYCTGNQAGLPGAGWHLPTVGELRSLVDGCAKTATGGACGVTDTCLTASCWSETACWSCPAAGDCYWDPSLQGDCDWYWSSSPDPGNATLGWLVGFKNGDVLNGGVTDANGVRCVRRGP